MMHSSSYNTGSSSGVGVGVATATTRNSQQQHNARQRIVVGTISSNNNPSSTTTDLPYRDDPKAPPSTRLESFTVGGYGHMASTTASGSDFDSSSKQKHKAHHHASWRRRLWQTSTDIMTCRPCCPNQAKSARETASAWLLRSTPTTTMTGSLIPGAGLNDPHDDNNHNAVYYYEDSFNDLSWSCTVGTSDENGIWLNQSDTAGTIMAILVWVLLSYSSLTMTFLAVTDGVPVVAAWGYNILATLAMASHVKTTLTDPGSVPAAAVPTQVQRQSAQKLSMCSQCQTFKPPGSHHCRICNRCISRMDHHCPWMNNCVGAANLKHFLLFLVYTWTCSVYSLLLLGWNYFFCATDDCVFHIVLIQLVRLMTLLSVGAFLFTSSMIMNVVYGLMTGVGTIDRLKKKAAGTMGDSEDEPISLEDVFGIGPRWQWFLPVDPKFDDYDRVMGYATPQRLLREQMRLNGGGGSVGTGTAAAGGGGGAASIMGGGSSVVTRESYSVPIV